MSRTRPSNVFLDTFMPRETEHQSVYEALMSGATIVIAVGDHASISVIIRMMEQYELRCSAFSAQDYVASATAHLMSLPHMSAATSPTRTHCWDSVLKSFFKELGLQQTLIAFETEFLVLNPLWEQRVIPAAAKNLVHNLASIPDFRRDNQSHQQILDERKLDCIHLSDNRVPQTQTSINRSIAALLASNRARNDESNRAEFLASVKNPHTGDWGKGQDTPSSCARTDAKAVDRDIQIKYDIAKNEDGPLRRTIKERVQPDTSLRGTLSLPIGNEDNPIHMPGVDERLKNIEEHLAVRYVPSPPKTLLARLKYLEDHIIKLEKDFPPWAALHFNQPNRGWPPPPRSIPLIVPPHLRQTEKVVPEHRLNVPTPPGSSESLPSGKMRHTASSLHRAVLEQLEVQEAMNALSK